ncbi:MAG TPA: GatB/YqeY domain-containing protein [Patescibacteria group bacterium]|nr:GatB/YqeY domain-containing protein [Patescibacteria group bacterium]
MIAQTLQAKIGEALKAGDRVRLETLKMLSSAFNYEKIEKQHDLTEEEELSTIRKQAKQRKDSIEAYTKAGRADMAKSEQAELTILQEFLPPEMDDNELEKLIDQEMIAMGAKTMADLGKVIGAVKAKAPSVDGGKIANLVKSKLSS